MPVEGEHLDRTHQITILTPLHAESGNMIIMALSYAQNTKDTSFIKNYVCPTPLLPHSPCPSH